MKKIKNNLFIRNVLTVIFGSAGAQLVGISFMPLITRLYGPEVFGSVGSYLSILEILIPITALSYPLALVLPKKDIDAYKLAFLAMKIALLISSVLFFFIIFFHNEIISKLGLASISQLLWFLPIGALISVASQSADEMAIRKSLYKIRSKALITNSVISNLIKSISGTISPTSITLVISTMFGTFLQAIMVWKGVLNKGKLNLNDTPSNGLLTKYRDFALYRTPQIFVNSFGQAVPVILMTSFSGASTAGLYILSRTILFAPSSLIGKSITDVFYPKFVESINNGENGRVILGKAAASIFMIGLVPYVAIAIFGPFIFSFAFGDDWRGAGEFARWMTIWLLAVLVSRPAIAAIPALNLQREFLIFELIAIVFRVAAFIVSFKLFNSAMTAVATYSIVSALSLALLSTLVLRKSANEKHS